MIGVADRPDHQAVGPGPRKDLDAEWWRGTLRLEFDGAEQAVVIANVNDSGQSAQAVEHVLELPPNASVDAREQTLAHS